MSGSDQVASDCASAGLGNDAGLDCPEHLEGDRVRWMLDQFQRTINAGRPIRLHAGNVRRVSTLALQVVAAARATALRQKLGFSILTPSPDFERACADTGLRSLLSPGD